MGHGQFHHADVAPPLTDKSITSDVAPRQHVFDQAVAGQKSANDWAQLKNQGSKSADNSLPDLEICSARNTVFATLECTPGRMRLLVLDEPLAKNSKATDKSHHEKPEAGHHGDKSHFEKHKSEYDYDEAIPMPQPNRSDSAMPVPQLEFYDNAIPMPQPKAHNKSSGHK